MKDKGEKETRIVLKKSKKEMFIKIITSVLLRSNYLLIPIFWSKAINYISNKKFGDSYLYIIIALILGISYWIINIINEKACNKLYAKLYYEYTYEVVSATYQNSMYSLSRFSLTEYINIANNDVDIMSAFFSNNIIRIVRMIEIFVILFMFLKVNYIVFLISFFISLLLFYYNLNQARKASEYNIKRKRNLDKKTGIVHEIFNGIKEIKGFNVYNKVSKRIEEGCNDYTKSLSKYNMIMGVAKYLVLGTVEVTRYCLMLYLVYLASLSKVEVGVIVLVYSYYTQMRDDFEVVGNFFKEYGDFRGSLSRFNKILEYRNNEVTKYLPKRNYIGKVVFVDVLYGNRNDPILNDVSVEFNANSINVITGKPGSGKTGVLDLILQMNKKHSGKILLDDDEIEKINPNIYYNLVSSCRKDPFFFKISIKDNFLLIDNDFEKAMEICKLLNIHSYISNLELGYDTIIDGNNHIITNEVIKMLGIARVILKNSKIMLFDEVISSLEKNNQEIVFNILNKLKSDHNIIIISRDNNVIKKGDNVIYMNENQIYKIAVNINNSVT